MKPSCDGAALEETLTRATKAERERAGLTDLAAGAKAKAPFAPPPQPVIAREGDTEYLLNGLIAECHYLMRELALPTAAATRDTDTRRQFLSTAMDLALTGAKVGKTVAGLRGAGMTRELRQRHIVEYLETEAHTPSAGSS